MKPLLDIAWKLLSILVIPLLLWGVRLEVTLAVLDTKLKQQNTEIVQLRADVKEAREAASAVKDGVNANAMSMGRMEEKLNAVDKNIVEVKGLLQSRHR